jgi:hypothetical protein
MRNAIANLLMAIGCWLARRSVQLSGLGREIDILIIPKLPPMFGQEIFDALLASGNVAVEPQKHLH